MDNARKLHSHTQLPAPTSAGARLPVRLSPRRAWVAPLEAVVPNGPFAGYHIRWWVHSERLCHHAQAPGLLQGLAWAKDNKRPVQGSART